MVDFSQFRNRPDHGLIWRLWSREEGWRTSCGNDHFAEISPSDLRYEEWVHHAARPLITSITWAEVDRRSLVASQFPWTLLRGIAR
jgi:hypothetical protein